MATGPEMLLQTLVKAFKLEPQIDKLREALDADTIERFKSVLKTAEGIDARLARIEQRLGIEHNQSGVGAGADLFGGELGRDRLDPLQLRNGTDN